MKHIILGYGEVGQAIEHQLIGEVEHYDKGEWEELDPDTPEKNILHICIPFGGEFKRLVSNATDIFWPMVTVIHSTVQPGTTLHFITSHLPFHVIYSPVMGRHSDDFKKNIKNYTKYFAGDKESFEKVEQYFDIACLYWGENTSELEFAKLSSTNYMYWNLIFQKLLKRDCDNRGYDFDRVYKLWNIGYNAGIKNLHTDWQRPIYDNDPDPVPGGHCLNSNIYLDDNFISLFLQKWQKQKGEIKVL